MALCFAAFAFAAFAVLKTVKATVVAPTLRCSHGWRDEYTRDNANQRTPVDASGNYVYEPAYGLLNARVVYRPADANWSASLWGMNLTDEQYVNGGFDTRFVWGYDFSVIGRSREVGVSVNLEF